MKINDRFTKLFAIVGILIAFPASYLTFESYYECYLEDNTTDYEITINNEDIYSCTDYKVKDNEYTKEGINLNTYETENYVLIYEDGDEIISSDTVENFKVKEIKTNRECLDFKDYVLAQFKGEI